jgi:hypothetical protein
LNLSSEKPVSKFAFKCNLYRYILRNTLYFAYNLFTTFYPIRTDRHLFVQVANTITVFLVGQGYTYTASNLPLRSGLAAVSLVVTLLQVGLYTLNPV